MDNEDYVSLEIAKLLKEKGFDVPCCSRPTLYEAQKWIRDTMCIHIEIGYMYENYWIYDLLTIPNHDLIGLYNRNNVKYESYEEALSAGIFEVLELITKLEEIEE